MVEAYNTNKVYKLNYSLTNYPNSTTLSEHIYYILITTVKKISS